MLALAVTAFGLYSLIAFDVVRRCGELAIRSVLGTVVSRGLGLALGLVAAALPGVAAAG